MQKLTGQALFFALVCFGVLFSSNAQAGDLENGINIEIIKESVSPNAEELPIGLPIVPDTKRQIIVMGAFATLEQPKLSTAAASNCALDPFIKQRYLFPTFHPFFLGVAIKNRTTRPRTLQVRFNVSGPSQLEETKTITVPAGSVCLTDIDVIFSVPGSYKLTTSIPLKGRHGKAEMFFDLSDNAPIPTPEPTATATPAPTGTATPAAQPTP